MNKLFTIVTLLLFLCTTVWGQGWIEKFNDYTVVSSYSGEQVVSAKSGNSGYYIAGYKRISSSMTDVEVKRLDVFGQVSWTERISATGHKHEARAMTHVPADNSYLMVYHADSSGHEVRLRRTSTAGQVLYDTAFVTEFINTRRPTNMIVTSDNHILVASTNHVFNSPYGAQMELYKFNLQGQLVWYQDYPVDTLKTNKSIEVREAADGNYLFIGYEQDRNGPQLTNLIPKVIKVDPSGNLIWSILLPHSGSPGGTLSFEPHAIIPTADGGYLMGFDQFGGNVGRAATVVKMDAQNVEEWQLQYTTTARLSDTRFSDGFQHADGSYSLVGHRPNSAGDVFLARISATGTTLFTRAIKTDGPDSKGFQLYPRGNGYAIAGRDDLGCFMIATDSLGTIYSNTLSGRLFLDENNSCQFDAGDRTVPNRVVAAQGPRRTLFGMTDAFGNYSIDVDSGTYYVMPRALSPYHVSCPTMDTVRFNGFYNNSTGSDFGFQVVDSCAFLEVDISAPFLRRCFSSAYYVNYFNRGSKQADNAYVEVTLDPYFSYDTSSIPLVSQVGNLLRFDVGTINAQQGGTFSIRVNSACDTTQFGQIHCTEAHIYPDTLCGALAWNGPHILTSGTCVNDTINFELFNDGAAMGTPRNYTIIEEHVMTRQATFQLGAGATQTVSVPATPGAMYRIEAEQVTGFPADLGDSIAISNIAACLPTLPRLNNPLILGQFYNGNSSPFFSMDCQPNIGAYDPNDKYAQPVGYGPQHYIQKNIPINYRVRFQNTGTDTAFTVVIVDTLDMDLDPMSIRVGASSHSYRWELRESNILVVTFDNIMLPDSNVNEPLSHGFVKFEIDQNPNLVDGTLLTNTAAIYFDFNEPIITNEVFHTIGSNFIVVRLTGLDEPMLKNIQARLYPNPFRQTATLEVEGATYEDLRVEVFNATGQRVTTFSGNGNQLILDRGNLPTGVYFYRLLGDDQLIATGKFITE